eukprot:TRINITY_DN13137_c0_g1_i1.p1 TRINITY_DN13137_c0_g1~~TRINITY_DN13137_c0_g1_i1.p1  ORF type:complete len:235 (-),score=45.65 TRINITY_DN13137_c0_g1_i1:12-716(-)
MRLNSPSPMRSAVSMRPLYASNALLVLGYAWFVFAVKRLLSALPLLKSLSFRSPRGIGRRAFFTLAEPIAATAVLTAASSTYTRVKQNVLQRLTQLEDDLRLHTAAVNLITQYAANEVGTVETETMNVQLKNSPGTITLRTSKLDDHLRIVNVQTFNGRGGAGDDGTLMTDSFEFLVPAKGTFLPDIRELGPIDTANDSSANSSTNTAGSAASANAASTGASANAVSEQKKYCS